MSSPLSSINSGRPMPAPAPVKPPAGMREAAPAEAAAAAPAPAEAAAAAAQAERSRRDLKDNLSRLNEHMQRSGRDLAFSVDEAIDRVVVTVKNSQTGEVVRQIPDESALRVAHSIEDLKGLLHNKLT